LFFQNRGFLYIHTPIITASDCEGAGEMFQVTTILPEANVPIKGMALLDGSEPVIVEGAKIEPSVDGAKVKAPKEKKVKAPKKAKIDPAVDGAKIEVSVDGAKIEAPIDGEPIKEGEEKKEEPTKVAPELIPFEERKVNYKKDLFGKPTFLTVSGQLSVENFCCALSDCYTFGPTFRAENSHTSRHLSEFWMIEPELAFATLEDNMQCAEDYLRFCLEYIMLNNKEDLQFFDQFVEKGLLARLQMVIDTPFKRVTYTEGIEILERDLKKNKKLKFENKVFWGVDLASEHEKYLTETVFKGPIILYNYPKDIKSFYMR
jgi:asparaginyl-tRNA synthetase